MRFYIGLIYKLTDAFMVSLPFYSATARQHIFDITSLYFDDQLAEVSDNVGLLLERWEEDS